MLIRAPYSGPKFFRPSPKMLLNFAVDKALDSRVTFTRASSGTYDDAAGAKQTASTNVARFTHDPVTLQSLGLLIEEARTNLLLNSETLSTQGVTVAATAYTISFQGTGTVTLSGTSTAGPLVGTSAQGKVSLTFTPTAGTLTVTVSGSVKYANLEAGSFATSWIPTTGATATRAADNASMTGSNFSDWYNVGEGCFVVDGSGLGNGQSLVVASNAGVTSYIEMAWRTSGLTQTLANVVDASVSQAALSGLSAGRNRTALAYKANDFALSANGGAVSTDSAGSVPTVDRLVIYPTSTIASIAYYPTRLSNSYLQYLTT